MSPGWARALAVCRVYRPTATGAGGRAGPTLCYPAGRGHHPGVAADPHALDRERVRAAELPGYLLSHLDRGLRAAHRGRGALQRAGAQAAPAPAAGGAPGVAAVDRGLRVRSDPRRGHLQLLVRDGRGDHRHRPAAPSSGSGSSTSRPRSRPTTGSWPGRGPRPRPEPRTSTWTPRPRSGRARRAAAAADPARPGGSAGQHGYPQVRTGRSAPRGSAGHEGPHRPGHLERRARACLGAGVLAAGRSIAPHTNPNTSLFIVVSGGGWVQVGEERSRIRHGEAVVWPAGVPHGAWTDGSEMRAIVVELPEASTELVIDGAAARVDDRRSPRPPRPWAPWPSDCQIPRDATNPRASPGSSLGPGPCRYAQARCFGDVFSRSAVNSVARPGTRWCACSTSAPGRGSWAPRRSRRP